MNDINVPIQEEVDNKKVLEESAEKLAVIASKLAEIFKAGFDAGFIGDKTKALLEAYKQDVIDYINEQLDLIVKGESADGVLNTIKELREALNNDADACSTLLDKISESNVAIAKKVNSRAGTNVGSSSRVYAVNDSAGDHIIGAYPLYTASEASEDVTVDSNKNYQDTIIRRSKYGTASIMNPTQPKHIANMQYVDAECTLVRNQFISGVYTVAKASNADTAITATQTEINAKAYASTAEDNAKAYADTLVDNLINGAPAALDTLKEISDALNGDADVVKTLLEKIEEHGTAIENLSYVPASIKSFAHDISSVEVGQTISSVVLSWTLAGKIKTFSLKGTGISGTITDKTLTTQTISGLSITADTSKGSWTLAITGEKGETATKPISSPEFNRRVYYGVSASESLDAAGVKALLNFLATSRGYTWTPSCSTQYIYYCIPKSFEEASFKSGVFDGGFNSAKIVSITNAYRYEEDYYVYRSTEKITGSITITVS